MTTLCQLLLPTSTTVKMRKHFDACKIFMVLFPCYYSAKYADGISQDMFDIQIKHHTKLLILTTRWKMTAYNYDLAKDNNNLISITTKDKSKQESNNSSMICMHPVLNLLKGVSLYHVKY